MRFLQRARLGAPRLINPPTGPDQTNYGDTAGEAGDDAVTLDLAQHLSAPAVARAFVAVHGSELPEDLLDDAVLLVSELVTDALTRNLPRITLRVRVVGPAIGVGVSGPAQRSEPPTDAAGEPERRIGIDVVEAVATAWGVRSEEPVSETTWFTLAPGPAHLTR